MPEEEISTSLSTGKTCDPDESCGTGSGFSAHAAQMKTAITRRRMLIMTEY
jgi:hypothetical protein